MNITPIKPPKVAKTHRDRYLLCQAALQLQVHEIIAAAVATGWDNDEVVAALADLVDIHLMGLAQNAEMDKRLSILRKSQT